MSIYRRLLDEVKPHWKLATGGLAFSIGMVLLELYPSVLTGALIDGALKGKNLKELYILSAALLGMLLGRTVLQYARMWLGGRLAQMVVSQLRTRLYEHLQTLSMSFYSNKRTGQIMSRVTNDVNVLEQFVVEGIRDLVVNLLKLILILVILVLADPYLALLTLIPTIPLAWGTKTFNERIRAEYRTARRRWADMYSILSDTITGIRVVQAFGQEEHEAKKFRKKGAEFDHATLNTYHMLAVFYPSVNLAFGLGQVIVWVIGGREVILGHLTLGHLMMFSGLVAQFYSPVQVLSQMSNLFANTAASGERVYEVLDLQADIRTAENAQPLAEAKGEVSFEQVSFGYDSAEPALQEVTLTVNPGETVGFVGPSGSGKSTLLSLVSRFYDVKEGAVKIDGVDVRELDLKDLRNNISVVLQESYLFHGTIRENIAYGRPQASFDEIMYAARAANAHDFIMRLPDGYDTHVGERGTKLSGGERQRISIARAILDDPKILILDEATSAVDTESEVQIQSALENLMEGRTTLAIAHRLSTVKNADKLVVMEQGRIVEMGKHEELVQREDGLYKRLVDMQTKLGKVDDVPSDEESAKVEVAAA
jgi:ABC-type multidrug transport system fused ATPase/permease subunit